jgi:hypothetical protein
MSLPFNIRADLTLSYFVILFFNYLQCLHVKILEEYHGEDEEEDPRVRLDRLE